MKVFKKKETEKNVDLDKKKTDFRESIATYMQNYCNRLFLTIGGSYYIVIGRGKVAIKGKGLLQ